MLHQDGSGMKVGRWTHRIAKGASRAAPEWGVPIALVLVMVLLQSAGSLAFELLVYERELIGHQHQWWRLWSGHWVHWSAYHLALNVGGLLVWVLLCPMRWTPWRWLGIVAFLSAMVSLWLYANQPQMTRYAGFSGVLHGLFLLGLVPHALRRDLIAGLCLLYLVGKIVWEQVFGVPLSDAERIGAAVATDAHLAGAIGALLLLAWAYYQQQRAAVTRV